MKVYSNKYENSTWLLPGYEFEVLNELKDTSNRTDANCLYHTRFLFEMDGISLDAQKEYILKNIEHITRVVYSGSKSYHIIIEFEPQYEEQCREMYRDIWLYINSHYFDSKCDTQCKNPSRLTRTPGVIRSDSGKMQELKVSYKNRYFRDASNLLINVSRKRRLLKAINYTTKYKNSPRTRNNDGLCDTYDTIQHYLNTPYTKVKGNGDSATSLFKAVRTCMKYNDNVTLEKVLAKARSEHWSEKELEHIQSNMHKYIE